VQFTPYTEELEPLVKAFNARLRDGGYPWRYAESHMGRYPRRDDIALYEESFLVLDHGQVRGGYHLKHQQFAIHGTIETLGHIQFPVSEGLVDPAYKMVGVLLLRDALRRQPLMLSFGGGGLNGPLPRLEQASGWTVYAVPFFFKVVHPSRFFSNVTYLRTRSHRRVVLDVLGCTGLGWAGIRIAQVRLYRPHDSLQISTVPKFGAWADELWEQCKGQYSFVAVRRADILNTLYPPGGSRYLRLHFSRNGKTIAWVVALDTQMSGHKQLGNMRVGSIADCLAAPQDAAAVLSAVTTYLQARNVDLIVSNQTNRAWCDALRRCGFLPGPSNVALGLCQQLAAKLNSGTERFGGFHFNRGDGDGPTNL